jgi:hypothetical protein
MGGIGRRHVDELPVVNFVTSLRDGEAIVDRGELSIHGSAGGRHASAYLAMLPLRHGDSWSIDDMREGRATCGPRQHREMWRPFVRERPPGGQLVRYSDNPE